ncbi:alpha/beta-hydrolase [Panus rudis PR-1116 ss-1]|nr:alpha/beta-hydrolase [Panus rudis PR-1116 ss-1]
MARVHLQEELQRTGERVSVETKYGQITGGRALNGAKVFLEVPYALPPQRFQDPEPLPDGYRYESKEYIFESSYAAQPRNDGQAAGLPFEDKVGLGKPTENPLFVNVVTPPEASPQSKYPVKVYIHGGFLQFGSPHGLSSQAQYVAVARKQVWVNVGYRLSAFGFLASDEPRVDGNFGFKDQWLALLWVREHIASFGGMFSIYWSDPDDIQVSGLSAGAHSVHQLLHHASRLPEGVPAPFRSAVLQSNAIVIAPKTPAELRPQFHALCRALKLDPSADDILTKLRDEKLVPWSAITDVIETDAIGLQYGTFRGCFDGTWLSEEPMGWQRSGEFARALKAKGVRSIVMGDLIDEWFLYSIAHPITSMRDIEVNLERYYQEDMVKRVLTLYKILPHDAPEQDFRKLFGEVLSEGQVHVPVRLLARDLDNAGFPFLRYEIRWTPEQVRPLGYVTHGTDRSIWALREPVLQPAQVETAQAWLDAVDSEVKKLEEEGKNQHSVLEVLALKEDKTIGWIEDTRWDSMMRLSQVLPGEGD